MFFDEIDALGHFGMQFVPEIHFFTTNTKTLLMLESQHMLRALFTLHYYVYCQHLQHFFCCWLAELRWPCRGSPWRLNLFFLNTLPATA